MIKALGKRILVNKVDLKPPKGSLLLIMPKDDELITAIVISIGCEVDDNLDFGDVVYIPQNCGIEVEINGIECLSIVEANVIAAWKDK